MYKIERRFSFAGGHRLSKHQGSCKNIHGHNYIVYVGLKSYILNENDMIMDFSDLKSIFETYLQEYDHCLVINKKDMEWLEPLSQKMSWKVKIMDDEGRDPTAEVMANHFYKYLKSLFEKEFNNIQIDYVTVYENENSKSTYTEE